MSPPLAVSMADAPGVPIEEILEGVRLAERLGYESFWLTEDNVRDSFLVLDRVAQATERIRIGPGVTSAYARTPTSLALAAATLQNLAGGRFFLGIGTGGPGFVTRGHGVAMEAPLRRVREAVEIARGLLGGDRLTYRGRLFRVEGFRIREPTAFPTPIYLGALNRRMTTLAGEIADGLVAGFLTARRYDRDVRGWVREGRERGGRLGTPFLVATLALVPAEDGSEEALRLLRRRIAFYGTSPHYQTVLRAEGFGREAEGIARRWLAGDLDEAADLVTPEMVERLTLAVPGEGLARRLRAFAARGILPVVYPVPRKGRFLEDFAAAIERVAGAAGGSPGA